MRTHHPPSRAFRRAAPEGPRWLLGTVPVPRLRPALEAGRAPAALPHGRAAVTTIRSGALRAARRTPMPRAPRIARAQAVALARPETLDHRWTGWLTAAVAVALLAAGLLGL